MNTILVTGGCGYIGSHTIVDLIENGYHVISIDNNSRSDASILNGVKQITGVAVKNYKVNLCNFDETHAIFQENENISGIIHFAAYKAVGESVENPLDYYDNNLNSLINILRCAVEFNVPHFVFSSSCTVYGNPLSIPVTEDSPFQPASSPYGATKQMGEEIVQNSLTAVPEMKAILLRYFNPVGAHPSIAIGELPIGIPTNLVPYITQTAAGIRPSLTVFGNNYNTPDGSCLRDFIHVVDLAKAHVLALQKMNTFTNANEVFNLGTGQAVSVLELITAFKKVTGIAINYQIGERREGDIEKVYAQPAKALALMNWKTGFTVEDALAHAWAWEQKLRF